MDSQLGRELSYLEAMAISVAIMAPTAAMALNGSFVAGIAGSAIPLTFLLAMVTIGLVSFTFIQFNRHFSHSGSVYAFTAASLGPKAGFVSGWTLLLTYLVFTAASTAEIGAFIQSFLYYFGLTVGWLPISVGAALLIWLFAFLDVRISTRVMLLFEGISIGLILVLSMVIFGSGGASHQLTAVPFTLEGSKASSLALASVFAFLSFAGFEGASSLGEETKNPRRAIPVAIGAAVFLTGIFYVLVSYAQVIGFGTDTKGVQAFAHSSAPLGDLAAKYISKGFASAIMFGAALSAFSSALGTATTGSRLLFSMGRDGFIHRKLEAVHKTYRSPYVALAVVMVLAIVQMVGLSNLSGNLVFGYLGAIGVLALLLSYLATNIGGIRYFVKKRIWRGTVLVVPLLAILALAYTLYSNVYPVPPAPYNIFPYIVIVWILAGVVIVAFKPALAKSIVEQLANESNISEKGDQRG
jgi:amino acid transporter